MFTPSTLSRFSLSLLASAPLALSSPVSAQCTPLWQPLDPSITGTAPNGEVFAMTLWDPDGSGPQAAKLAVGGSFRNFAGLSTKGVAAFDFSTRQWSGFGQAINGSVHALAALPDGDLIAAGQFSLLGTVSTYHIARWDGTAWSSLGSGMNGPVAALVVLPNGDLIAGGYFSTAGGTRAYNIARWDGTTWSPLGVGLYYSVSALALLPSGELIAGSSYDRAALAGANVGGIALWDGSTWSRLGAAVTGNVSALTVLRNGDVVAAGTIFYTDMPVRNVIRWNGAAWSTIGPGTGSAVRALVALPNDDLVAAGSFTTAGTDTAQRIARWNGDAWTPLGSGVSNSAGTAAVRTLALLPGGDLVAGGLFAAAGGITVPNLARWSCPSTTCRADFTQDGVLNTQDILAYLTAYFTATPTADINADATLSVQDIFDFLTAYFAGC